MPEPAPKTTAFSTIGWVVVFCFVLTLIIIGTVWGCARNIGGSTPPAVQTR